MKKQNALIIILLFNTLFSYSANKAKSKPLYLDTTKPIEERVDDLMSKMTLEEKVAQMCQYLGPEHIKNSEKKFKDYIPANNDANGMYPTVSIDSIYKLIQSGMIGSFLHVTTPEESNFLQSLVQKGKLKIPLNRY